MFGNAPRELPQKIALLLVPQFSLIAFTSVVEAMRVANRMSGRELYRRLFVSTDGQPVVSSCGVTVAADGDVNAASDIDCIIVCAGLDVQLFSDRQIISWLRRGDRRGLDIGAICTGSHVLARIGLLDGYRCTIHWKTWPGSSRTFRTSRRPPNCSNSIATALPAPAGPPPST